MNKTISFSLCIFISFVAFSAYPFETTIEYKKTWKEKKFNALKTHNEYSGKRVRYSDQFVQTSVTKEIKNALINYNYTIKNVADSKYMDNIAIGSLFLGLNGSRKECVIPSLQKPIKLSNSISEWNATYEYQEEGNTCIVWRTKDHAHHIKPGESMTFSVFLENDNVVYEQLPWVFFMTSAPRMLSGQFNLKN